MTLIARKVAIACLVAGLTGACAVTEDIVPVPYKPTQDPTPIVAKGKSFKLNVTDKRGVYRGQIGAKVNGYGQEMAAIRSTVPIQELFRAALTEELTARGIAVDGSQVRAIDVAITALHNNFKVGFVSGSARGIAAFTVRVTGANGALRYNSTIADIYEEGGVQIASGENAAKAVAGALSKAMTKLFDDDAFIAALTES